ncbi:hypothetical protein I317_00297 [Kwoniella heveanensis CBS 569]|uniref:Large ribosomal subunit protein uL23m n=1 Tax=Kwoniella heveanensis BCC8398 TaxID=1296120 RepID=A0A1B9GN96_9TREE|nr:hypothetical protein I316_05710 [Kwoniella heveanensis BCC8398]OCF45809.1 hypothetical protein I317_00297 [Kwoniella heveanensis CBS 569]
MSRIIRRALSTFPPRAGPSTPTPTPIPTPSTLYPSAPSATSTLPQAVRRRRLESPPHPSASPSPLTDADLHSPENEKLFPLALERDYQDLIRSERFNAVRSQIKLEASVEQEQGEVDVDDAALRALFLKGTAEWRSRVRGYAPRGKQGRHDFLLGIMTGNAQLPAELMTGETAAAGEVTEADGTEQQSQSQSQINDYDSPSAQVVGQRVYLPNIQIRLMRNHTPEGEAYDPFIATFRIPPSMTKNDLRSYLLAVYNLKVSFIRTDNYIGEVGRTRTGSITRKGGASQTYKRAVVGLYEPFHYPDDMEELYAKGLEMGVGDKLAKARDTWLQQNYSLDVSQEMRKRAMFKYYKGGRWRSKTHANMGNTMREIMKRRQEREDSVAEEVKRRWALVGRDQAQAQTQTRTV